MGGKWTTCRPIAIDTLKEVEKLLSTPLDKTKQLPLIGTSTHHSKTVSSLIEQQPQLLDHLPNTHLREKQLTHLQSTYGLEAPQIIANKPKEHLEPLSEIVPICKAEIEWAIKHEHAQTPTDLLARRCRLAMVDLVEAQRLLPLVQEHLSKAKLPLGELNLKQ